MKTIIAIALCLFVGVANAQIWGGTISGGGCGKHGCISVSIGGSGSSGNGGYYPQYPSGGYYPSPIIVYPAQGAVMQPQPYYYPQLPMAPVTQYCIVEGGYQRVCSEGLSNVISVVPQ